MKRSARSAQVEERPAQRHRRAGIEGDRLVIGPHVEPAERTKQGVDLPGEGQEPAEKEQTAQHAQDAKPERVNRGQPERSPAAEHAGFGNGGGTSAHFWISPKSATSS